MGQGPSQMVCGRGLGDLLWKERVPLKALPYKALQGCARRAEPLPLD